MKTSEFVDKLPKGPLVAHIRQVHQILQYITLSNAPDPNALAVAEHSLREMAVYTSNPEWVRDGIRRETLDEFMTALKEVTAHDPRTENRSI